MKKSNKTIRESHLRPGQKRRKEREKLREDTALEIAFRKALKQTQVTK